MSVSIQFMGCFMKKSALTLSEEAQEGIIMKRILLLSCVLVMLTFVTISCNDNGAESRGGCEPSAPLYTLAGTSWKLVAIVDTENNVSRQPDYDERGWRDEVYTLTFINDSLIEGRSEINRISGLYSVNYDICTLLWHYVFSTSVCCDWGDGDLYGRILTGFNETRHFKLYLQELRIFYNDGKEYLKFNKIEGVHNEY